MLFIEEPFTLGRTCLKEQGKEGESFQVSQVAELKEDCHTGCILSEGKQGLHQFGNGRRTRTAESAAECIEELARVEPQVVDLLVVV